MSDSNDDLGAEGLGSEDIGIGVLITGVVKAKELLNYLLTRKERDRNKRFDAHYQPLFDGFLAINRDYLSMFSDLRDELSNQHRRYPGVEIPPELREHFRERRQDFDNERTALRALSQQVVASTQDKLERKFLFSLLAYFLEYEDPFREASLVDISIDTLVEGGHSAIFNTPSSYVLYALASEKDVAKLISTVTNTRDRLTGYASQVTTSFINLRTDVKKP